MKYYIFISLIPVNGINSIYHLKLICLVHKLKLGHFTPIFFPASLILKHAQMWTQLQNGRVPHFVQSDGADTASPK